MTYHRVCKWRNTTSATGGAGTAYPSRSPDFTPDFSGIPDVRHLVFSVVLCRYLSCCRFFFLSNSSYEIIESSTLLSLQKSLHCLFFYLHAPTESITLVLTITVTRKRLKIQKTKEVIRIRKWKKDRQHNGKNLYWLYLLLFFFFFLYTCMSIFQRYVVILCLSTSIVIFLIFNIFLL